MQCCNKIHNIFCIPERFITPSPQADWDEIFYPLNSNFFFFFYKYEKNVYRLETKLETDMYKAILVQQRLIQTLLKTPK